MKLAVKASNLKIIMKIEDIWLSIDINTCKKLSLTFRDHEIADYRAKGMHTKH